MEKRIELERRGKEPGEVIDLCLDNSRATQIVGLDESYTDLESLSIINVGLTTLKGFPKLPKLEKLELSDNRISNSLHLLEGCPNLTYLNLSGNRLKDLEAIEPLKALKNVTRLDISNNPIATNELRPKIFEMLPHLKYLDGLDINNVEEEEDCDLENGEEEDEDLSGEEEESDEDDKTANEPGLASIYNDDLGNEEDEEEYQEEEEEDENDHEIEEEEEDDDHEEPSSKKPKVDESDV